MRIAFITACLAPGRDGVGDYTRDLASACEARGHSSVLLALNDRHIEQSCEQVQSARGATLASVRLAAASPWPERLRAAQHWLQRQDPEWISLQFVAYGFHPKGLVGDLGNRLATLIGARPLHLMLHELWIGMERGAPWRRRLIGRLQRHSVLSLIQRLDPAVVQTSNATYSAILERQGLHAQVLPLCGSIPVALNADMQWLGGEMLRLGVSPQRALPRDVCWRFGLFGSLHPAWSPEPLFAYISEAARRADRQVIIASIGRRGPGEMLWQSMQSRYGERFSLVSLGERSTDEVSAFLQSIDFGVATTPWRLIGKSATAAAMLDHGLPVIVSRDDQDLGVPAPVAVDPLLYRMDQALPEWLCSARRQPPQSRLPQMAEQFIADIESQPSRRPIAAGNAPTT